MHFVEVRSKMATSISDNDVSPESYIIPTKSTFDFKPITRTDVAFEIMNKMSFNKATGLDAISSKIVKVFAAVIAPTLTCIFNKVIKTGTFLYDWKMVTPLHNRGSKCDSDSYQLISILPFISKIFERI